MARTSYLAATMTANRLQMVLIAHAATRRGVRADAVAAGWIANHGVSFRRWYTLRTK